MIMSSKQLATTSALKISSWFEVHVHVALSLNMVAQAFVVKTQAKKPTLFINSTRQL